MKLTDYLALTGLTRREFASLLGVSNSTVTRLVYGETVPSRELLAKIASVTDRRVLPADIYADV
jgi:transcriptional regulator with XRE-family HTH domain